MNVNMYEENSDFEQVDDYTSALEFPLDVTVVVQEGCYPDIEDENAFRNQAEFYLYDKDTGFEYEMTEVSDVIEDLLSLLEDHDTPEAPGRYRMTGAFKLAYDMSGLSIQHNFEDYGPEEGVSDDKEFYSDDLSVTFNKEASSVKNLNFELITEACISVVTASIRYNDDAKPSSVGRYDTYQTAEYDGRRYAIHYVEVDSSPEADENKMYDEFAAQISVIAPYDDAEYVSARIEDGIITYMHNQKAIAHQFYLTSFDMGYENPDWVPAICDMAIEGIARYNQKIQPKMIHN